MRSPRKVSSRSAPCIVLTHVLIPTRMYQDGGRASGRMQNRLASLYEDPLCLLLDPSLGKT